MAEKKHYSVPPGVLLPKQNLTNLLVQLQKEAEKKDGKDVDLPCEYTAMENVVKQVKGMCGSAPSLVFHDSKINECINRILQKTLSFMGAEYIRKMRKELYLPELRGSSHSIFLSYPVAENVYNIFFQVRGVSFENDIHKKLMETIKDAISQCDVDKTVFSTICGPFLGPQAVVVAFPAFPFIHRRKLSEFMRCEPCSWKILTKDDLQSEDTLKCHLDRNGINTFPESDTECTPLAAQLYRDIFSLYVCVSSSVDIPRTDLQHFQTSDAQMERTLRVLTPEQKRLVGEVSWLLLLTGGSGTGKTIVIKERAKRLAEEFPETNVLLVHVPGGQLTGYFRLECQGQLRYCTPSS